jgi:hypothetical protein
VTARRVNKVGLVAAPKESKQQEMLFEWMSYVRVPVSRGGAKGTIAPEWLPLSDLAFAVPNGTSIAGTDKQRAMYMAALKRQGFKVGVSDIVIPFPTVAYHGLYLELKRDKKAKISDAQKDWRALMRRLDYRAEIAIGFDEAKAIILDYLSGMHRTVSRPTSQGMMV